MSRYTLSNAKSMQDWKLRVDSSSSYCLTSITLIKLWEYKQPYVCQSSQEWNQLNQDFSTFSLFWGLSLVCMGAKEYNGEF